MHDGLNPSTEVQHGTLLSWMEAWENFRHLRYADRATTGTALPDGARLRDWSRVLGPTAWAGNFDNIHEACTRKST